MHTHTHPTPHMHFKKKTDFIFCELRARENYLALLPVNSMLLLFFTLATSSPQPQCVGW